MFVATTTWKKHREGVSQVVLSAIVSSANIHSVIQHVKWQLNLIMELLFGVTWTE